MQRICDKIRIIKEYLKVAQAGRRVMWMRRRDLKFQVGDKVFLKVTPMKGIKRFGMKGKLSPRFVGLFKV